MRHLQYFLCIVLLTIAVVPQSAFAQSPPDYNRAIDSVWVFPQPPAQPRSGQTKNLPSSYMVGVRGLFSVTDTIISHDLSMAVTISADDIVIGQYTVVIDQDSSSSCARSSPPHCQNQTSCGGVLIGELLPYNWMGIEYQGCCDLGNYCACCTIWLENSGAAAFGPYNLDPGAVIDVRVDPYGTGEAEIYTNDDFKTAIVPPVTSVPTLSEWGLILTLLSLLGLGIILLRRRSSRTNLDQGAQA